MTEKGQQETAESSLFKSLAACPQVLPGVSSLVLMVKALLSVSDADLDASWVETEIKKCLGPLKRRLPLFIKLQGFSKEFGKKLVPEKFALVEGFLGTYSTVCKDFLAYQRDQLKKISKIFKDYRLPMGFGQGTRNQTLNHSCETHSSTPRIGTPTRFKRDRDKTKAKHNFKKY